MIGISRCVAGKVRFNFEDLSGPVGRWIESAFGPLEACAHLEMPTEITIRFVDRIDRSATALRPLPLGPTEDGLLATDHLGHKALISFPISDREILVERDIDPWFFQRWIYMPLLRASLWQHRVTLIHAAGVELDNKRVVFSGWSGAGKSPLALRMMAEGGRLIGDDWIALSEDGTVYPVTAHLNLNTWHAPHLGDRSHVVDKRWLRRVGSLASAATRLFRRYPKASMGFSYAAKALSAAGKTKVSIADVFPGAEMASAGRVDAFYFLPMPGMADPKPRDMAEMVAASVRSELLYMDDLENTIRFSFPQLLDGPLFGPLEDEAGVIAAGLFPAHRSIIHSDGSASHTKRVVGRIRRELSQVDGTSEVA